MDQLETQVSDLRSFLGAAAAPTPQGQAQGRPDAVGGDDVVSAASVASVVSAHDTYSPAPGPLRASSHHSSRSAPGDNSAPHHHHPRAPQSPLDLRDGHAHTHAHAHAHAGSTSSSTGTVANNNNAAKRRADDEEDDGPARQQRSKRNRVGCVALRCVVSRLVLCSRAAICVACHLSPVAVAHCHCRSLSLSLSPWLTHLCAL